MRHSSDAPSRGAKGFDRKSSNILSGLSTVNSANPTDINKRNKKPNEMKQSDLRLKIENL